jgi:hypothetical protein
VLIIRILTEYPWFANKMSLYYKNVLITGRSTTIRYVAVYGGRLWLVWRVMDWCDGFRNVRVRNDLLGRV